MPVEGIPSPGHDGPTFLDLVWYEAPFATHGDFVAVVAAAGRAAKELAP